MLYETLLAALGAVGFAIIFGMKRSSLWVIFLVSGVSWYAYLLLCKVFQDEIPAMFFITVFVVVFAKMITLFMEGPVILFSTPILIPFIPGSTLYYVMADLVGKKTSFTTHMWLLLRQVGAMALGILVAEMIMTVAKKAYKHRKY